MIFFYICFVLFLFVLVIGRAVRRHLANRTELDPEIAAVSRDVNRAVIDAMRDKYSAIPHSSDDREVPEGSGFVHRTVQLQIREAEDTKLGIEILRKLSLTGLNQFGTSCKALHFEVDAPVEMRDRFEREYLDEIERHPRVRQAVEHGLDLGLNWRDPEAGAPSV